MKEDANEEEMSLEDLQAPAPPPSARRPSPARPAPCEPTAAGSTAPPPGFWPQDYIEAENRRLETENGFWAKEIVIKIEYKCAPRLSVQAASVQVASVQAAAAKGGGPLRSSPFPPPPLRD